MQTQVPQHPLSPLPPEVASRESWGPLLQCFSPMDTKASLGIGISPRARQSLFQPHGCDFLTQPFVVLLCWRPPEQSGCQSFTVICDRAGDHGSLLFESQFVSSVLFVGRISRFGASTGEDSRNIHYAGLKISASFQRVSWFLNSYLCLTPLLRMCCLLGGPCKYDFCGKTFPWAGHVQFHPAVALAWVQSQQLLSCM